jgi:hypothetical protein
MAPSYISPNAGGGCGVQLYTWSPINLGDLHCFLWAVWNVKSYLSSLCCWAFLNRNPNFKTPSSPPPPLLGVENTNWASWAEGRRERHSDLILQRDWLLLLRTAPLEELLVLYLTAIATRLTHNIIWRISSHYILRISPHSLYKIKHDPITRI